MYVRLSIKFNKKKRLKIKKKLKILFVKPADYLNLYLEVNKSPIKTILSSIYRFGPVGIFAEFKAKFLIANSSYNDNFIHKDKLRKNILRYQPS